MEKVLSLDNKLVTENIYVGMYSDEKNKRVINEEGNIYTIPYIIVRFGILYKIMDNVYLDVIQEKLVNENKIDSKRIEKLDKIINFLPKYLTVEEILTLIKNISNAKQEIDYIESFERDDNIKFETNNKNLEYDLFEDFLERVRKK